MLNENAKKWVAALRSGKFKQTKDYLHFEDGYCCLGVACEVAMENGLVLELGTWNSRTYYNENNKLLPRVVQKWLGLKTVGGLFNIPRLEGVSLTELNDSGGLTFEQIADVIEFEPKGLFVESELEKN